MLYYQQVSKRLAHLEELNICGLSTNITNSPAKNSAICSSFWKVFNQVLAANKLQQGTPWTKYAITYTNNNQYTYMCTIPALQNMPPEFQTLMIPASDYLVFEHRGHTRGLVQTLEYIYQNVLPNSKHTHDKSRFLHFEKYGRRFNWNNANSLIEIWLPISINEPNIYHSDKTKAS